MHIDAASYMRIPDSIIVGRTTYHYATGAICQAGCGWIVGRCCDYEYRAQHGLAQIDFSPTPVCIRQPSFRNKSAVGLLEAEREGRNKRAQLHRESQHLIRYHTIRYTIFTCTRVDVLA